jgi:hypothetical protein
LFTLFLMGILFDYRWSYEGFGISTLNRGSPVYAHLRDREGKLLELPLWRGDDHRSSIYEYNATLSKKAMVNGYAPFKNLRYVNEVYWRLFPLNLGEIGTSERDWLWENGVRFVTFHEELYFQDVGVYPAQFALDKLNRSPYLAPVLRDGPVTLFELTSVGGDSRISDSISDVGKFLNAEDMEHQTGKAVTDPDAAGGKAFGGRAGSDPSGFLVFGPFGTPSSFPYPSGTFRTVFRIRVGDGVPGALAATLEVAAHGRDTVRVLAARDLYVEENPPPKYHDQVLTFTLDKPDFIEFRAFFHGNADLRLDYIWTRFENSTEPLYSVEAEEMFHFGDVVEEAEASGDKSVILREGKDPIGLSVNGPWRFYPDGSYRIGFRMKADGADPDRPVADLEIFSESGGVLLKTKSLFPADFSDAGKYRLFQIESDFRKTDAIAFRTVFHGNGTLWVDRMEVYPLFSEGPEDQPLAVE